MTRCSVVIDDIQCGSAVLAKGLCAIHYDRKRRTGSVLTTRITTVGRQCDADGCERQPIAGGLCRKHYQAEHRAARRAERQEADARECENCGGSMRGKQADARFCSRKCKGQARISDGRAALSSAEHYYRSQYGMSRTEIVSKFGNSCNICGTQDGEAGGRHGVLHVDHCHTTGQVRGMLCDRCNTGIGKFRDDPILLRQAAVYIETSRLPATTLPTSQEGSHP
jgi:hypothetical protein